jgi:L,D-transpeptidase YcbB
MPRSTSLAACASLAAMLALVAATPVRAQAVASETPPQAPPAVTAPPPGQAPEGPAAAAPPVVEVNPILAQVRQQLTAPLRSAAAADRAAAVAFYGERNGPVWVTAEGFTAPARLALAEVAKADDWGLSAKAFELPVLAPGDQTPAALADAEIKLSLAVLKYARHARGGRLDPSQVSRNFDQKPSLRDPKVVLETIAATDAPGDYLRSLHPSHAQFERLRQALLKVRAGGGARPGERAEPLVRLPDGPTLKVGMEHPHVGLLRRRLKVAAAPGTENQYDPVLQDAVRAFQEKSGIQPTGTLNGRTRSALNGVEAPTPTFGSDEQRLVVNMERWRWMPEDMGDFHVWDNIPEYQTRVVRRGQVVHQAKIIVGRPETATVVFSANMRYVIFGPEWGVPDSIKIKEILPYLRPTYEQGFFGFSGGVTDTRILERHNLRVTFNGRPVDASQVDWSQVDIRKYNFVQPSGATNVLGAVKFRFPNKHDIYMHDTPQRELFEKTVRTFSHGCIRVHNPGRLAEVLLEEDRGWSAAHVKNLMAQGGNYEVTLQKQIPVHITYFTAMVGDDGQVKSFGDIYGHDNRVSSALAGRPMPLEPPPITTAGGREDGRPDGKRDGKRDGKQARQKQPPSNNDVFSGLFGN